MFRTFFLFNSVQVTVDGLSCSGSCIFKDWQNQWFWNSDGSEPASTLAARVYSSMVNFTNGQLLVFGGLVDAVANNETWLFDPLAKTGWRLITGHLSPLGRWSAACCSDGSIMYMHGGVTDDASSLSDLWSFNVTSLTWSQLLPLTCNSIHLTCAFAARSHVLVNFMTFLYVWDTLGGRFARFNLVSSLWEPLTIPSVQRFQHISVAQISTGAFVLLGLTTDAASNVLYMMNLSPKDPVNVKSVNISSFPLVVGGCMLAFSSQILVLGGKSAATSNRYRLLILCRQCFSDALDTPTSCNDRGDEYGFWLNFDTWNEYGVEPSFGSPLCGSLPSNIGSACAILNNSVVSVGGFDCSSAQRLQVSSHFQFIFSAILKFSFA
jgi:hypothetical protein